jgi:DNA-binding HxlR family transcriptional regulator
MPDKQYTEIHSKEACTASVAAVKDTIYALGGKWKLPIIIALSGGPMRFRELQKALEGITPKVLSKELKELELNEFVTRTVYDTTPVTVEYALTSYSRTLDRILKEMRDWGIQHRQRMKDSWRKKKAATLQK